MTAALRTTARLAAGAAIGTTVVGALAGCASAASASGTGSTGTAASAATSTSSSAASTTSGAKDGSYTETGTYQTPGGTESITVTLSVKSGVVTAVKVTGSPTTPNAQHYQAAFESGISGTVVGKPLATLKVGAVSGSSLTGAGFDAAVAKIRADAA